MATVNIGDTLTQQSYIICKKKKKWETVARIKVKQTNILIEVMKNKQKLNYT